MRNNLIEFRSNPNQKIQCRAGFQFSDSIIQSVVRRHRLKAQKIQAGWKSTSFSTWFAGSYQTKAGTFAAAQAKSACFPSTAHALAFILIDYVPWGKMPEADHVGFFMREPCKAVASHHPESCRGGGKSAPAER